MDSPGFLDIFESGYYASVDSAEQWDKIWDATFGLSSTTSVAGELLFSYLSNMGLVMAAACLVFVAINNVQLLGQGNYQQFFLNMGMSLIVVIFLSNGGKVMAQTCYAGRDILLDVNKQLLSFVVDGVDLQDAFRQLQELRGTQVAVSDYLQQCEYLTGQEQQNCLREVITAVEGEIDDLKAAAPIKNFWQKLSESYQEFNDRITDGDPTTGPVDPDKKYSGKIGDFILPTWENMIFVVLGGFMRGYQSATEITLILTAVVSPIAMGISLFPWGMKWIVAWVVGFFSIGIAKLAFNLMAGLAAVYALNDFSGDQNYLYILFGLFAPMFASGIAAGGGMAIWQSLTGAVETTTSMVSKGVDVFI